MVNPIKKFQRQDSSSSQNKTRYRNLAKKLNLKFLQNNDEFIPNPLGSKELVYQKHLNNTNVNITIVKTLQLIECQRCMCAALIYRFKKL